MNNKETDNKNTNNSNSNNSNKIVENNKSNKKMSLGPLLGLLLLVLGGVSTPYIQSATGNAPQDNKAQTVNTQNAETADVKSQVEELVDEAISEIDAVEEIEAVTESEIETVGETETVSEEESAPSVSTVQSSPESIPEFSGNDYYTINGDVPNFTQYDIENISGEYYSPLDDLGRCGPAYAMLEKSLMPTGPRQDMSAIKPSGWKQRQYPGIVDSEPPKLYNRSHLIAFALAGEDANELNLITGTRYFNAETMLPYEEQVMRYIEKTNNHVLYRVTPLFIGTELVARGVEMEAYSVEDDGKGICYHVFVYNYQPGIDIDYQTGKNWLEGERDS